MLLGHTTIITGTTHTVVDGGAGEDVMDHTVCKLSYYKLYLNLITTMIISIILYTLCINIYDYITDCSENNKSEPPWVLFLLVN